MIVTLIRGYEVNLDDEEGLCHLFRAIFMEALTHYKDTEAFEKRGFDLINEICTAELYFVAGQLFAKGSSLTYSHLNDGMGVIWDQFMEELDDENDEKSE